MSLIQKVASVLKAQHGIYTLMYNPDSAFDLRWYRVWWKDEDAAEEEASYKRLVSTIEKYCKPRPHVRAVLNQVVDDWIYFGFIDLDHPQFASSQITLPRETPIF